MIDKGANLRIQDVGAGQWDCAIWEGDLQGKGVEKGAKQGQTEKGVIQVSCGQSLHLSGWALCLIPAVCPFLLDLFLTNSLSNFTFYTMCGSAAGGR